MTHPGTAGTSTVTILAISDEPAQPVLQRVALSHIGNVAGAVPAEN